MSIGDIFAIQNLLPGSEPDLKFVRPGEPTRSKYWSKLFSDPAYKEAAYADFHALADRLNEEYGDDTYGFAEALGEILEDDERLRYVSVCLYVDAHWSELQATAKNNRPKR